MDSIRKNQMEMIKVKNAMYEYQIYYFDLKADQIL